jgi:fructose-bisphosphate aldolase class I
MSEIENIAKKMVASGKGILAADESTGTMTKRLSSVNVESTLDNRLKFREILFSAEGMKNYIGGVILYDETIKQKTSTGKTIPELISSLGSIPGIKVDTGAKKLAGSPDEKVTEGLDGLRERLENYFKLGARFTKWRAVYNISNKYPSVLAIKSNAHALARYAALVQEAKMVPIVEPEVLMDGDHDIKKCYEVTTAVLKECYKELSLHNINLKGTILKPNMILPGNKSKNKSSTEEIARMTLECIKKNVPSEVPGIAFLSGGQTEIEATQNLNEINKINDTKFAISFSYGRALQQSALKNWAKNISDINNTQKIFNHRSKMNGLSTSAKWSIDLEKQITL